MSAQFKDAQRRAYLTFTERLGGEWLVVFQGNTEFYSAAYWDLLTGLWRQDEPVRKTDALAFMQAVKSPHTAGKYVETAVAYGYVIEAPNPEDARSRLLSLSPDMRQRMDAFFDRALEKVVGLPEILASHGPIPASTP